MLWDYIREHAAGMLGQPRVQPLTLLDLDEFELLLGLVEAGASVIDVLRRKADSAFGQLDIHQWLQHDPAAPREARPSVMEQRMSDMFLDFGDRLGLDASIARLRDAIHDVERQWKTAERPDLKH